MSVRARSENYEIVDFGNRTVLGYKKAYTYDSLETKMYLVTLRCGGLLGRHRGPCYSDRLTDSDGHKMRCSWAQVLDVHRIHRRQVSAEEYVKMAKQWTDIYLAEHWLGDRYYGPVYSGHNSTHGRMEYRRGAIVEPDGFGKSPVACARGIHFFVDKRHAIHYW